MAKTVGSIRKENAYEENAYTYYPVLIIGAGESGIAMGCRLREVLGFDQFRIFDRQAGIGGTWWINRYPGIACDVPATFYSFSFAPNHGWTTLHPSGPEIVNYLQSICEKYQIVDKIQLNTDVTDVRWLEDDEEWEVILTHMAPGVGDLSDKERREKAARNGPKSVYLAKETVRAKIIASAVGGLVEPKAWPTDIPGHDKFEGEIFHTGRWKKDVDLAGKDVIVVGTGCSAAQVIPQLTKPGINAKSVTQLMRSPPWVAPPLLPHDALKVWEKWTPFLFGKVPGLGWAARLLLFSVTEADFFKLFKGTEYARRQRAVAEEVFLDYMKRVVPEKYHEILTPDYGIGCKRRVIDDEWFRSLQQPNIDLTTLPLTSIQPKGVTLGPGRHYPSPSKTCSKVPQDEVKLHADAIILANGFETNTWLHPLNVRGKGGKNLHDVWDERGGPQAYMGAAMDGFPNFFIIFGPNTATGHSSVILASENMINYSLKFMKPILNGDVNTYEVKKEAEISWTKTIQDKLKNTVWMEGGCRSWYKRDDGWNSTVYPFSQIDYTLRCMFPKWSDWNVTYTRKGQWKHRARQILGPVMLLAAFVGLYWIRKAGGSRVALWKALRT